VVNESFPRAAYEGSIPFARSSPPEAWPGLPPIFPESEFARRVFASQEMARNLRAETRAGPGGSPGASTCEPLASR